jgi:hypothetical protein
MTNLPESSGEPAAQYTVADEAATAQLAANEAPDPFRDRFCPRCGYCLRGLLALAAESGVHTYFFHPRWLPVELQNRAVALSYIEVDASAAKARRSGTAAFSASGGGAAVAPRSERLAARSAGGMIATRTGSGRAAVLIRESAWPRPRSSPRDTPRLDCPENPSSARREST